ncbi:MAG: hypothetical protein MI808_19630 [Pseudomonadales bacterium]|nr:hypothetical protein [Pseudomonadales bacterium]
MGMMKCEKHGMVGAVHSISKDLCDLIRAGILVNKDTISLITVANYEGEKFLFNSTYLTTNDLLISKELETNYKVLDDVTADIVEKKLESCLDLDVVCVECFKNYMHAINFDISAFE